jgi:type I restriction enzyme S subunit
MRETLASLADIHYGSSPNGVMAVDGTFPIYGTGGVYGKATCSLFPAGIVVARKGSLGSPHLVKQPFWPVDTTYAVIPKKDVDIEWLYFCLLNFDLTKLNEATGVPSISRNWLAKIKFLNPGHEQQKYIAACLASIDTAIEKTEALIAKHQQIKAGLMHDLFTRGVLPNGQLRPPRSEAPELYQETVMGWIPCDWQVTQMHTLAEDRKGSTTIGPFGSDLVATDYRTEGVPVVFVRDVKESGFQWNSDTYVSQAKAFQLRAHKVSSGEVLATKMGLPPCISCVYPEWMPDGVITADMIRLAPDTKRVNAVWLAAAINHDRVMRQVAAITAGVTRPKVTLADFRSIRVALPRLEEQQEVISQLSMVERTIAAETERTAKLKKQKLGLMQDLLTGRVLVPATPEPAEAAA